MPHLITNRTPLVFLVAGVAVGCAARPARPPAPVAGHIDTLAMRAHTFFLASDLLAGRATGSQGAAVAALYIEAQCRALGLRPVAGRFAQPVPLQEANPRPDSTWLAVGERRFEPGRDFLIVGGTRSALAGFRGLPVYLGTADDVQQQAAGLPPLRSLVAVVGGAVPADAATVLAERGAVGIVQVVDDSTAFARYVASRGTTLTLVSQAGVPSSFYPPLPAVIVGPSVVPALRSALRPPVARIELEAAYLLRPLVADNVACLLPGDDAAARDTAIAFTAHFDHLGVSVPDASGDSIYNGFSDNAAGVGMLLAIARAIRQSPTHAFRHSVLFLFFTGEERGLLGSDYFVARPSYPLERIRAVINLDAGAPPAPPWAWRIAGGDGNPLGDLAILVAEASGWSATTSPATANSDYFPFTRRGVPAIFLVPGSAPYEGLTADSSRALRRRWDRYHQPGDAFSDDFPFAGLRRYAEYAYRIAEAVDRGGEDRR